MDFTRSASPVAVATPGVRIDARATQLTVMLYRPTALARALEEPRRAGLRAAVDRQARLSDPARVGDHGNDAAPAALDHGGQGGTRTVEHAVEVGAHPWRPFLGVDLPAGGRGAHRVLNPPRIDGVGGQE